MNGKPRPYKFLVPRIDCCTLFDIEIIAEILAGFCGFMSILSSLRYCLGHPSDHTNIYFALAFIPFGLFFDFMDGKVARWRGKSSLMGQELDSLADEVRQRSTTLEEYGH